jgi:hypothetical protein
MKSLKLAILALTFAAATFAIHSRSHASLFGPPGVPIPPCGAGCLK